MPATAHSEDFPEHARLFSEKLQRRKTELELSQLELASRAQVSVTYINLLLNNAGTRRSAPTGRKPPNPTLDIIWRLADAFEVSVDYLMDRDQPVRAMATR
ncbi:MAG TPA: helix-turn-helix transcriptional regulator [Marmoricola sp.]|nr:helix-turn-helix transcriptional regulator [Marmoricola sp.]